MSEGRLGSGLGAGRALPEGQYTSGKGPAYVGLCLGLVERFLAMDTLRMTAMEGDIECSPRDLVQVDRPQAFLDTLVGMLAGEAEPRYVRECSHLFTPVLNSLYARGHNGFVLDLRELACSPESVAQSLYGAKGTPLDITCILGEGMRTAGAGGCVHESRVTFYGRTGTFGHGSTDSTFVLHGTTEFMGASSLGCTYVIPHAAETDLVGFQVGSCAVYDLFFRWAKDDRSQDAQPPGTATSPAGILTDRASLVHLGSYFFKRGNILLVPDGRGSWKEVRP